MCSDPSDDLAGEFARLVAELGRERASQIWLDRFAGYDEGQTWSASQREPELWPGSHGCRGCADYLDQRQPSVADRRRGRRSGL